MRVIIFLLVILFCIASARAQSRVRYDLIPLPPPMQFIDRIQRPCSSGASPFVSAIAASDGDFDIVTCAGRQVTVNGVPLVITPGGGLGDPGSNGYVVRTALNTTVARTFSVGTPITITNANGVAGNTTLACPTCVTSAAALTSTALMTGAGLQAVQTPSATATLLPNGNVSTPGEITVGSAGGTNGAFDFFGATSGTVTVTVKSVAGTWTFTLPDDDGAAGQFLQTDGAGITSWQTVPSSGGTVTGTGTTNAITKWSNGAGGVLADSRITDNGTDITANSGAGAFSAGDTGFTANGVNLILNDATNTAVLQSDGNGEGQALNLSIAAGVGTATLSARGTGGPTGSILLSSGGGAANIQFGNLTAIFPNTVGGTTVGTTSAPFGQVFLDATVTAGGTTGNQTINKSAGSVNFAAAATSLTVTSNKVTANSIVICTVATNDTTLKSVQCVSAAGSFTMFGNAAATAETRINFWILNQ